MHIQPYLSKVVVRLGAFHTEMIFVGANGHLMNDSGLYQVRTVYVETTVGHMPSGQAVAEALLRGHGLVHMGRSNSL